MDLYVSPSGNDAWDGSHGRPKASLIAAVEAIRAARPLRKRIILDGGRYYEVALLLGPEDSGLVLEAAPGKTPVLVGGRQIAGWVPDGHGFMAAPLEGVQDGRWDFRTLLVNGHLVPRARLPKEGAFEHESVFAGRWMSTTAGGWDRKPTAAELTTMRYREGDLGEWLDVANAEVTVYHQWDESLVGVSRLDPATRTLTFKTPCGHPPGAFASWNKKSTWYVVWNVREGMHEPGQWYLDRTRGRVVYWPKPGEDPRKLEVVAPSSFAILRLSGRPGAPVCDVTLRGLTLMATTTRLEAPGFGAGKLDGAVTIEGGAERITVEGLRVANVGGQGIRAVGEKESSCKGIRIERCVTESIGGPGVYVRGEACTVTDTRVHRVGLVYPSSLALSVCGSDCLVAHNEISVCPYTAIQGGGRNLRFEYNRMSDYMRELDDGAAIYVFGGKGVIYRGNVARGSSGRLAHAYYLDEQCEDCLVEHNLAVNTRWPSHNHMAARCTIRDNLFMDDGPARITLMRCEGFRLERNTIVCGGAFTLLTPTNGLAAMPGNIIFSRSGERQVQWTDAGGYATQKTEALPLRDGSVAADPLLRETAPERFLFGKGSPAHALGLQPMDFSRAGIRSGGGHKP